MPDIFGDLFTMSGFFTLLMLLMLQAVLGFDNLLYISIEAKKVSPDALQKLAPDVIAEMPRSRRTSCQSVSNSGLVYRSSTVGATLRK